MRSPVRSVPGFEASVGRRVDRWKYFSLPFNSLMSSVSGSIARSLAAVGLSSSVAVNVFVPIVTFIFLSDLPMACRQAGLLEPADDVLGSHVPQRIPDGVVEVPLHPRCDPAE